MYLKPILVAEDSDDDALALMRSFQKAGIQNPVVCVSTGRELIRYVMGSGKYSDRVRFPMPGIIFLDVRMPEMDGFEVLDWLRQSRDFVSIPIVMLTGAIPQQGASKAYEKGAVLFLTKPCEPEDIKLLPDPVLQWLQFESSRRSVEIEGLEAQKIADSHGGMARLFS